MRRSHAHGFAILNSGAMHIFAFWVRVIPITLAQQLSIMEFSGRLAWDQPGKNETMYMVLSFQKISKFGATAARAHSLTFYAPARFNRYPRITDAAGRLWGAFGSARGSGGPLGAPLSTDRSRVNHLSPIHARTRVPAGSGQPRFHLPALGVSQRRH